MHSQRTITRERKAGTVAWLAPGVATVLAAGFAVLGPATHAQAAVPPGAVFHGYQLTFEADTSQQWEVNPNGALIQTPSALETDSSPSNTALPNGQYDEAFRGSLGALWLDNSVGGGQPLPIPYLGEVIVPKSGTSPSIASDSAGDWEIAYVGDGGLDGDFVDVASSLDIQQGVYVKSLGQIAPHTSPAIAGNPDGFPNEFVVTWIDPAGHVRWVSSLMPNVVQAETQFTAWPGTDPAVAWNNSGAFEIVATSSTSRVWQITNNGGTVTQTLSAANGTPAVTALSNGTFVQAFQASSGILWVGTSAAGAGTIRVAPNTAPTIAANSTGGWEAAIQGLDGHPETITSAGAFTDIPITMEPGTSPSITSLYTSATSSP